MDAMGDRNRSVISKVVIRMDRPLQCAVGLLDYVRWIAKLVSTRKARSLCARHTLHASIMSDIRDLVDAESQSHCQLIASATTRMMDQARELGSRLGAEENTSERTIRLVFHTWFRAEHYECMPCPARSPRLHGMFIVCCSGRVTRNVANRDAKG
jgi:hypothetical protein